MVQPRLVPCLLLSGRRLVKTVRFRDPSYVGDPVNTVRIFNEQEVDELVFLDIDATRESREPAVELIREIASEAFMPFAYGGGVRSVEVAGAVLSNGAEKVVVNSALNGSPGLVGRLSARFGAQSVVCAIDVSAGGFLRRGGCMAHNGRTRLAADPVALARSLESEGAGELLLTSIDREGTFGGYDLDLVRSVSAAVGIPVVAHGGAGGIDDCGRAIAAGASAAAAGSIFVFQGRARGVLVNYPPRAEFEAAIARHRAPAPA